MGLVFATVAVPEIEWKIVEIQKDGEVEFRDIDEVACARLRRHGEIGRAHV